MGNSRCGSGQRTSPLSIRLSAAERETLERRAGGRPLSTYAKQVLFAEPGAAPRSSPCAAGPNREILARILARLGQSELATGLAELARQAQAGNLYCDERTVQRIGQACLDVRSIRLLLLGTLGKRTGDDQSASGLSETFQQHAAPEADQ